MLAARGQPTTHFNKPPRGLSIGYVWTPAVNGLGGTETSGAALFSLAELPSPVWLEGGAAVADGAGAARTGGGSA